jgi:hypothetical protein
LRIFACTLKLCRRSRAISNSVWLCANAATGQHSCTQTQGHTHTHKHTHTHTHTSTYNVGSWRSDTSSPKYGDNTKRSNSLGAKRRKSVTRCCVALHGVTTVLQEGCTCLVPCDSPVRAAHHHHQLHGLEGTRTHAVMPNKKKKQQQTAPRPRPLWGGERQPRAPHTGVAPFPRGSLRSHTHHTSHIISHIPPQIPPQPHEHREGGCAMLTRVSASLRR